jgi:hypothetical protein
LAQFASQPGMLHPVYLPSEPEEQDRQVWRLREQHKTRLAVAELPYVPGLQRVPKAVAGMAPAPANRQAPECRTRP